MKPTIPFEPTAALMHYGSTLRKIVQKEEDELANSDRLILFLEATIAFTKLLGEGLVEEKDLLSHLDKQRGGLHTHHFITSMLANSRDVLDRYMNGDHGLWEEIGEQQ